MTTPSRTNRTMWTEDNLDIMRGVILRSWSEMGRVGVKRIVTIDAIPCSM